MNKILINESKVIICGGVDSYVVTCIKYQRGESDPKYLYDLDLIDGPVFLESKNDISDMLECGLTDNVDELLEYKIDEFGDIDLGGEYRDIFENISCSKDKDNAYLLLLLIFLTRADFLETEKQLKNSQNVYTSDLKLDLLQLIQIILED